LQRIERLGVESAQKLKRRNEARRATAAQQPGTQGLSVNLDQAMYGPAQPQPQPQAPSPGGSAGQPTSPGNEVAPEVGARIVDAHGGSLGGCGLVAACTATH
jgi:hypothetical protein